MAGARDDSGGLPADYCAGAEARHDHGCSKSESLSSDTTSESAKAGSSSEPGRLKLTATGAAVRGRPADKSSRTTAPTGTDGRPAESGDALGGENEGASGRGGAARAWRAGAAEGGDDTDAGTGGMHCDSLVEGAVAAPRGSHGTAASVGRAGKCDGAGDAGHGGTRPAPSGATEGGSSLVIYADASPRSRLARRGESRRIDDTLMRRLAACASSAAGATNAQLRLRGPESLSAGTENSRRGRLRGTLADGRDGESSVRSITCGIAAAKRVSAWMTFSPRVSARAVSTPQLRQATLPLLNRPWQRAC